MSGSSENDSSHRSGGESDCEGSAASSHEFELSDPRKSRRNEQIQGKAWILRGEITTPLLRNDSASMDCDADKIQNPRQRLLSGQKLKFCLETSIQTLSTLSFSATLSTSCMLGLQQQPKKIKIQIRGFLELEKNTVASTLEKLLMRCPVSAFLSGKWDLCKGGLYGNKEYET
jgi:hypothetical protein